MYDVIGKDKKAIVKKEEMHILDITLNEIDVYLTRGKMQFRKIIIELNSILQTRQ